MHGMVGRNRSRSGPELVRLVGEVSRCCRQKLPLAAVHSQPEKSQKVTTEEAIGKWVLCQKRPDDRLWQCGNVKLNMPCTVDGSLTGRSATGGYRPQKLNLLQRRREDTEVTARVHDDSDRPSWTFQSSTENSEEVVDRRRRRRGHPTRTDGDMQARAVWTSAIGNAHSLLHDVIFYVNNDVIVGEEIHAYDRKAVGGGELPLGDLAYSEVDHGGFLAVRANCAACRVSDVVAVIWRRELSL